MIPKYSLNTICYVMSIHHWVCQESDDHLTLLLAPKYPRGNQALAEPFIQIVFSTSAIVRSLGQSTALGNQASTLGLKKFSVFR